MINWNDQRNSQRKGGSSVWGQVKAIKIFWQSEREIRANLGNLSYDFKFGHGDSYTFTAALFAIFMT